MSQRTATLIHFNDVYNAEKGPRFVHKLKQTRPADSFCIFSGDALSPSVMSTIVRGKQMIPILNAIDIDVACLGNHDLDFGVAEFEALRTLCNFPWLCSNVISLYTDEPLGGCQEYAVLNKGSTKVLAIGLIESEWMDTLATVDPEDIEFEVPTDYVKRRVPEILRQEGDDFDMVIAVTHQRMPNDYKLAENCADIIDIILGGHDHHYEDSVRNGVRVLNSGTDFKEFTMIKVDGREESRNGRKPLKTTTTRVKISSGEEEDPQCKESIKDIHALVETNMDIVVGTSKVALDARFSEIRTKETNIGNFIASLMVRGTDADIAILNAGTIRADRIIPPGNIKVRDLSDLLPMADELAVVELDAERLLKALENGVSQYPAMEGRFPCVDGVRFKFDPSKPAGSRVIQGSVYVRDRSRDTAHVAVCRRSENKIEKKEEEQPQVQCSFSPLDPEKTYRVVSKAYLLTGKDGYDEAFVGARMILDAEQCPVLPTVLRNVFTEISILKRWAGTSTRGTVIAAASKFKKLLRRSVVDPYAIAPTVDGRIVNVAMEQEE